MKQALARVLMRLALRIWRTDLTFYHIHSGRQTTASSTASHGGRIVGAEQDFSKAEASIRDLRLLDEGAPVEIEFTVVITSRVFFSILPGMKEPRPGATAIAAGPFSWKQRSGVVAQDLPPIPKA